ncbi:MAG TPA: hypothetical protein VIM07_07065 [Chitinophagaceae bacterium]
MVKVISCKTSQNTDGKPFFSLKLQGGVEAVQSQQTGKVYLTTRTCYIATTFDEGTAESLVGTQLPGTVQRVLSEPYEYTVKETGEVIMLSHRYEYTMEETSEEQPVDQREFATAEM